MLERRLLSLALASASTLALACGGGEDPTSPGSDPVSEASSLSVSPSSAQFDALGDTTHFSATVTDQDGDAVSDVTVDWSSTDGSVVTVGDEGEAEAEADGSAGVIASAEGLADTASVTVDQVADEVDVSPSVDTLTAGDSLQLSAESVDANGNAISGAEFVWSSSDESVATVDSTGLVRAESDGAVEITAELDALTAASDLTVEPGPGPEDGPVVSSVSPTPLPEGGTATISGSNFDATADGNTVTVDGVEATVNSASSTSLEIAVPQYDCRPARDVSVEVSTGEGSDAAAAGLTPEEAPVALAVGEQSRIGTPSDFCLQFEETSASERYLVGVQSLSDVPGSLTPVTVTAETADGNGDALSAPISLATENSEIGGGEAPRASSRITDHEAAETLRRLWERRNLRPSASLPAQGTGSTLELSKIVSGSVQEGDTVSLRVPDDRTNDLCANFVEVGAEVKAIGTEGIFVADTANPSGGFTDTDYQDFSDRMDDDIFSTLVDYFGSPTDLDGNSRVVVLVSKEVNVTNPDALGFVFGGDLFPRSSCASSDEGEIYYGKAPDPDGDFGDPYPTDDARLDTPFLMAHELTHVIQQSRRFASGQDFMSSSLAEAQATLGEEVVGHSVTGRTTGQDHGFDVAFNTSGSDEINWYDNGFSDLLRYFGFESSTSRVADAPDACGWWREDPSPCVARPLWYGVGWTFLRWASDNFGPSYAGGEEGFHRDLVDSSEAGPEAVADVLGEPFEELMAQWAASLYVDGRISGAHPRLTITSWDLFDVEQSTVATADLQPLEMDFSDWQAVGEIRASSAGYLAVEEASRPATAIRVRGDEDGTLPSDMQIWIVRLE